MQKERSDFITSLLFYSAILASIRNRWVKIHNCSTSARLLVVLGVEQVYNPPVNNYINLDIRLRTAGWQKILGRRACIWIRQRKDHSDTSYEQTTCRQVLQGCR